MILLELFLFLLSIVFLSVSIAGYGSFLSNKIQDLNKQNVKLKILGIKNFSKKLNKLLELVEKKNFSKPKSSIKYRFKLWIKN